MSTRLLQSGHNLPHLIGSPYAALWHDLGTPPGREFEAELGRSNYSEPSSTLGLTAEDDADGSGATGRTAKGRARQTISDKRDIEGGGKKKKSNMNIRTAVLYKKSFALLLDESLHPRQRSRLVCYVLFAAIGVSIDAKDVEWRIATEIVRAYMKRRDVIAVLCNARGLHAVACPTTVYPD
ncbi:hypothetical protein PHLCEN_2v4945 [Hermanssonia centrifuga]|uniref:Uncharacterized protein n=1 Tax=Hermanssonia centrifuga TaxID=98765 RepID=A0A2R6PCA7_9APHY|nr:hypothetical protein PHLCEN_2v4945 [Hermanssonia centrifuga]